MSDDWSLKGKEKVPYYDREMLDADDLNSDENERYYPVAEINILFNKLVKDLQKWASESDKYEPAEIIEPIRIIQKRFGMEEMNETWNIKQELLNMTKHDHFTKPTQIYMADSLENLRSNLIKKIPKIVDDWLPENSKLYGYVKLNFKGAIQDKINELFGNDK